MSDLFQIGEEASSSKLVEALEAVRLQGAGVLEQLDVSRLDTLVQFERRLSAMNGRRQRANRVTGTHAAVEFAVSDFLSVDQAQTTATVRADAQAVTLRERSAPSNAAMRSKRFSTSGGTAESMDSSGNLYRVHTDDGSIPTGTFELELVDPLTLTLLVFDLAAMPSDPTIVVEASANGTTYVPAKQVMQNGYRLNAWLDPMSVRFIRVSITPSHPDTLGGRSFTFGLTSFNASTIQFHLLSELVSRPMAFVANAAQLKLVAEDSSEFAYFIAFNGKPFVEVQVGDEIDVPDAVAVSSTGVGMDENGKLAHVFPADGRLGTLRATEEGTDVSIPVVPGLAIDDSNLSKLTRKYITVNGTDVHLVSPDLAGEAGKTFKLEYVSAPASTTVQFKVQLTTPDRTLTPVFRGAVLEEI